MVKKVERLSMFVQFAKVTNSSNNNSNNNNTNSSNTEVALNAKIHPLHVELKNNHKKVDNQIDFGDVKVNASKTERLIVTNMSPVLPISIVIDKMSNFAVHPQTMTIVPGGQEVVNVMFTPRQGGPLTQTMTLSFRHAKSRTFARRQVVVSGMGLIEPVVKAKVMATKSAYVTNLNELNPGTALGTKNVITVLTLPNVRHWT